MMRNIEIQIVDTAGDNGDVLISTREVAANEVYGAVRMAWKAHGRYGIEVAAWRIERGGRAELVAGACEELHTGKVKFSGLAA